MKKTRKRLAASETNWAEWFSAADAANRAMGQPPRRSTATSDRTDADRAISIADLNQLRLWIETMPEVPEGNWYKDFGSFKICGNGSYPKKFLLRGQIAKGEAL